MSEWLPRWSKGAILSNMLFFLLGILSGLALCLVIFAIETRHSPKLVERIENLIKPQEQIEQKKVEILFPLPDSIERRKRVLEQNEEKGLPTKLEDIF